MPKSWRYYAVRAGIRCVTFYVAVCLVQLLFDGTAAWLPNIFPAVAFALVLTYMQARLTYLKEIRTKRKG